MIETAGATLLQLLVLLLATPALAGIRARRSGAPPDAPLRTLARLWRKSRVVPGNASPLLSAAPAAALACAAAAALLVPTAATASLFAPGADLLTVAALLAASRAIPALASFDAGAAPLSHAALTGLAARVGAVPVLVLVALATSLLAAGTNLDAAVLAVRDGGTLAHAAGAAAGAALLLLALGPALPPDLDPWTGRARAFALAAWHLRGFTLLSAAVALACPYGIASAPDSWLLGVLAAAAKLGVGAVLLAVLPAPPRLVLPAAAILALAAAALARAATGA